MIYLLHAMEISLLRKCVTISPDANATLHVFADTSPKAYGAEAYLQVGVNSFLVMSKARAAPLKQHSLLWLELMATVTVAHFLHMYSNHLPSTLLHACCSTAK